MDRVRDIKSMIDRGASTEELGSKVFGAWQTLKIARSMVDELKQTLKDLKGCEEFLTPEERKLVRQVEQNLPNLEKEIDIISSRIWQFRDAVEKGKKDPGFDWQGAAKAALVGLGAALEGIGKVLGGLMNLFRGLLDQMTDAGPAPSPIVAAKGEAPAPPPAPPGRLV